MHFRQWACGGIGTGKQNILSICITDRRAICVLNEYLYLSRVSGRGVGEMIVRWLVGQTVQRNITKIYLETSKPGRKLYEKTGFLDMPDMMKLQTVKSDNT